MPEEASTTSPGQIPAYLYIFDKHPMGLSMVETYFNALPSLLLTIILLEDLFFFLVLRPLPGLPQGVHGPGRPIGARPSPPPCGWSFGFITEPRTVGLEHFF